jgi:hypothetical protein
VTRQHKWLSAGGPATRQHKGSFLLVKVAGGCRARQQKPALATKTNHFWPSAQAASLSCSTGRAASQVTSSSRDCAASRASPSSSTGASSSSSARYGLGAHGRPILRRRGQPDICPRSARMASHPDDFV